MSEQSPTFPMDQLKLGLSATPILAAAAAMTFELGYFSRLGYDFFWQLSFYDHVTTILTVLPWFICFLLLGQALSFPNFLLGHFFDKKNDARKLKIANSGEDMKEKMSDEYFSTKEPGLFLRHKLAQLKLNSLERLVTYPLAVLAILFWAYGVMAITVAIACVSFVLFEELRRHLGVKRFIAYVQGLSSPSLVDVSESREEIARLMQVPKKTLISYSMVVSFSALFVLGSTFANVDSKEDRETVIGICVEASQCGDHKLVKAYRDGAIVAEGGMLKYVSYDRKVTITKPAKEAPTISSLGSMWDSDKPMPDKNEPEQVDRTSGKQEN